MVSKSVLRVQSSPLHKFHGHHCYPKIKSSSYSKCKENIETKMSESLHFQSNFKLLIKDKNNQEFLV